MHAAAAASGQAQCAGYTELHQAFLRDYSSWTTAAALLATLGFAGVMVVPTVVDEAARPLGVYVAKHLYVVSMTLSSALGVYGVNRYLTVGNYYNRFPAAQVITARNHLIENCKECSRSLCVFFRSLRKSRRRCCSYTDGKHEPWPQTNKILQESCGLAVGSGVFLQSVAWLCVGEPQHSRWHLGCIPPRVPAILVAGRSLLTATLWAFFSTRTRGR